MTDVPFSILNAWNDSETVPAFISRLMSEIRSQYGQSLHFDRTVRAVHPHFMLGITNEAIKYDQTDVVMKMALNALNQMNKTSKPICALGCDGREPYVVIIYFCYMGKPDDSPPSKAA